ncbi:hypothetical protein [Pseudomonas sp. MWU12-2323]|uniref:hypothetical protein n=1 Tax=Pseudomonas sp. MWU12-2323 TaxID=2651296 RepID=UPI00128CB83A|nr:hypothetical protein [Pseudomonas sp. MWU12-2323]MPQ69357.1 hypothetical protein [Pseudomonas sp. MWU12-2323]
MFKNLHPLERRVAICNLSVQIISLAILVNAVLFMGYLYGWKKGFQMIYGDSLWSCVVVSAVLVLVAHCLFKTGRIYLAELIRLGDKTTNPQPQD